MSLDDPWLCHICHRRHANACPNLWGGEFIPAPEPSATTENALAALRRLYEADASHARANGGVWPRRDVLCDGRLHRSGSTIRGAMEVAAALPADSPAPGVSYGGIYIHADAATTLLAEISE